MATAPHERVWPWLGALCAWGSRTPPARNGCRAPQVAVTPLLQYMHLSLRLTIQYDHCALELVAATCNAIIAMIVLSGVM